ncbi:hypothetical protein H0H93_000815, partial [Arthromyces matolae]
HHDELEPLPEGDVLVHAGDLTHSGTPQEVRSALQWLADQPHPHKIFIAGNHDYALSDTIISFPYLPERIVCKNHNPRTYTAHLWKPFDPKARLLALSVPAQFPREG